MNSMLILGAGGHSKVVVETAVAARISTNFTLLDDNGSLSVMGNRVYGPLESFLDDTVRSAHDLAFVAIGNPRLRLYWIGRLLEAGYKLPILIHPTAWASPSAFIGCGSAVFAHSAIQSDACIGIGTILNTGCSIDHDSVLSDGVHLCPGARLAGEVNVGTRTWIGIGASVIQQVRIGSDVTVGAGAAVVRDLPSSVTAVGVPARVVTSH